MPPFVGRKRLSHSPPPTEGPRPKRPRTEKKVVPKKAVPPPSKTIQTFSLEDDDDSSSSLSDVDSDDFEDVPKSRIPRTGAASDGEDDEVEWEDTQAQASTVPDFSNREFKDVKITVNKDEEPDFSKARTGAKKGPSRREKAVRIQTHKMHVQMLLWHNSIRNAWANDKKVQDILLKQLPAQITREIEKWKRASGIIEPEESPKESKKDKKKKRKNKLSDLRSQRDWAPPSQRLEEGKPDMSRGDPLISLLKVLAAYWRKRFAITAPGLRKRGYGTKLGLRQDIESFRNDKHNPARHGEKIESLMEFRNLAEKCEGSRDAGAQLFTALLRAIGIETRLVASLQPVGYGFTKVEEMVPRRIVEPVPSSDSDDSEEEADQRSKPTSTTRSKLPTTKRKVPPKWSAADKTTPIDLDTDSENASDKDRDDDSVIDVTPLMPKARPAKYDRDLIFPVYWIEAVSPITSRILPVCPLVLENAVATSADSVSLFEPRGAKADKARQVMAYVVAYSSDRTAKDVTVRYLRKRLWPGKTKGFRVPIERIPIYDERGKVSKHEDYDWFKHVLSIYTRSDTKRTAVDDVEDVTDLVPAELQKKEMDIDTLQSLKSSAEFVLERHLRREEALRPGVQPVRTFVSGKGDKETSEPVYKRNDVLRVATAESWHKEGRAPKAGEVPIKLAPVRAVTLARKREAEEHQIRTGEKQMQGLYSQDQTDWIIPPPIEDGKIPKNSYGNIDCFVPSMVPRGAVHVPLKGTVRICKKLEIDFAEAVVGFEFGNKMAVPVIQGVVIATENEQVVRDAWREWNEEQRKKEESKMEKLVLDLWRKFVLGLRIRARVQDEYTVDLGGNDLHKGATRDEPMVIDDEYQHPDRPSTIPVHDEHEFGGGFLPESDDETTKHGDLVFHDASQEDPRDTLVINDHEDAMSDTNTTAAEYPTPVSGTATGTTTTTKRKRTQIHDTDDSDDLDADRNQDQAGGFIIEHSDREIKPTTSSESLFLSSLNSQESSTFKPQSSSNPRKQNQKQASTHQSKSTKPATTPSTNAHPHPNPKSNLKSKSKATTKSNSKSKSTTTAAPPKQQQNGRTTPARTAKGKARQRIALVDDTDTESDAESASASLSSDSDSISTSDDTSESNTDADTDNQPSQLAPSKMKVTLGTKAKVKTTSTSSLNSSTSPQNIQAQKRSKKADKDTDTGTAKDTQKTRRRRTGNMDTEKKPTSLLRNESTVVMSPYFDGR